MKYKTGTLSDNKTCGMAETPNQPDPFPRN